MKIVITIERCKVLIMKQNNCNDAVQLMYIIKSRRNGIVFVGFFHSLTTDLFHFSIVNAPVWSYRLFKVCKWDTINSDNNHRRATADNVVFFSDRVSWPMHYLLLSTETQLTAIKNMFFVMVFRFPSRLTTELIISDGHA